MLNYLEKNHTVPIITPEVSDPVPWMANDDSNFMIFVIANGGNFRVKTVRKKGYQWC